jgi:hypothetical protein
VVGATRLLRRASAHHDTLLVATFFVGTTFLIAVLPAVPGARSLLVQAIADVPALGLLRDGHRWLAPLALAEAALVGAAVAPVRAPRRSELSWGAAIFVVCAVSAALINVFGGINGQLRCWSYPPDFVRAAQIVNSSPDRGNVLLLPWSSFRDYAWVKGNTVLDPMPRMLSKRSIASRVLIVSGRPLQQEGELATAVDEYTADQRLTQAELASLSVGWVMTERQTSGRPTAVPSDWPVVLSGPTIIVQRNPRALPGEAGPGSSRFLSYAAFLLYGWLLVATLFIFAARRWGPSAEAVQSDGDPGGQGHQGQRAADHARPHAQVTRAARRGGR